MELFIETLTGTAFELRVSPFETVVSVKAKIQRLEGIPISHQHLIWQSVELEDDYCLHDYNIHNGATLKLVLAMRGGPINTRRIPVEDSAIREMAEYMEANRDEILDKLPGNSNVTLLVFREGDKLNFFRVVDPRPDGSLTPLSESEAVYSAYNMRDDEDDDDEDTPSKEKTEENSKMKEKMDQLRINMEKISLTKKRKYKTPSPGHGPHSSVARMRLRGLPSSGRSTSASVNQTLNKNMCLPPVGHTFVSPQLDEVDCSRGAASASAYSVAVDTLAQTAAAAADTESSLVAVASNAGVLPTTTSAEVTVIEKNESAASPLEVKPKEGRKSADAAGAEGASASALAAEVSATRVAEDFPSPSLAPHPPPANTSNFRRDLLRLSGLAETPHNYTAASARRREAISMLETLQEATTKGISQSTFAGGSGDEGGKTIGKRKVSERWEASSTSASNNPSADPYKRSPISSHKDFVLDSFMRPSTTTRRKEFALEGLTSSEARTVSGMLRQASIEKIGSSHIGSIVSSASKSRMGNYCSIQEAGRITTPESRMVSARLQRVSASGERHRISPTHRLPPVKVKKKQKRCFLCGKKTGLATSYQCRCGNNFCASHRYAESHDCTFDYKTEGRKLLEQSNPLVSAPKLPKI
ncbi:AN1-type zinc finger protein 4 isoform X2 [Aplysia californica]|uniref:AN1-type zinc finger protein 4 isoform X2 n=1 Tax=Aplysia californica TaxID=6500 RepID=A0ABM0K9R2_APLCA|nr:AN1-type zinc finger protein 4 isoform X2 [Aplysia californica]